MEESQPSKHGLVVFDDQVNWTQAHRGLAVCDALVPYSSQNVWSPFKEVKVVLCRNWFIWDIVGLFKEAKTPHVLFD